MNDTQTPGRHPRPPRLARILANTFATAILRSRWHRLRSDHLLLLTFTGRTSGKQFTTPLRYRQEGDTLLATIVYPWWKNLVAEPKVRVLLRGRMCAGVVEVLPEAHGEVVVKIYLER